MKKIQLIWPSILYKRPISKNSNIYNAVISKYNSNKVEPYNKTNEEEPIFENKLTDTVRTDSNKHKFNYLYSNFNNFKKLKDNTTYNNSSRYSSNNRMKKNKLKKIFNETQDNNSLFFLNKGAEGKIFPNFNNNTCNISLNQHFYNIDYKNITSSQPILKKDDTDNKNEKPKNIQKYKYIPNIKNNYKNMNSNRGNKKNKIYLNSFSKNFPFNLIKDIHNSYDSFDNNSNSLFANNISSKNNKKKNIINLFVNPDKKFLDTNRTTDLNAYTNLANIFTHRKIQDKLNLTSNNNHENNHQIINTDNHNFKYQKKIISHNSFNKKNENYHNSSLKINIPLSNYKNHLFSLNKSQERINDNNKSLKISDKLNNGYNSFIANQIGHLNYKKNLNSIKAINLSNKNNNFHSYFYKSKLNNNNNINQNNSYKRSESKNLSERKKLSTSIPALKSSLNNNYKYEQKKLGINNIIYNNNSINGKNSEKNNLSLLKLKNNNINNKNKQIFINLRKETPKENKERLNTTKPHESSKKKINEFPSTRQRLKKINLNKLLNDGKIKAKINKKSPKGKKDIANLKKIFLEHFSTEGNKTINNNLSSNRQNNLTQNNNNNMNFINIKPRKKTSNNDNIINTSLGELLKKFRKTKKILKNIDLNKKQNIQENILTKKNNYIINQSNSQINVQQNSPKNNFSFKINKENSSNNSDISTKTKESNEFMEQSQKLSNYIKDYYETNSNYPQTNLNFYRIGRVIGQGGFAKVNLGLNILTGRVVAIKSFNKNIKTKYGDKINMDKILYEINLMKKLNHQNITKILETFEDEQFYFIIMEYINGGNLFSYVKKRRKLSEKVSKFLFRQIILGIKHIHSQLIVHRDIKLENILIDMNNNIKICDFGIGIILSSENQMLHSHCGTPMYIAPEIILSNKEKGYKGFPVDIWSAGIALYIMISGKLPFNLDESPENLDALEKNKDNKQEKNKRLKEEILKKEPKYIENISDELRDLLKGLLNKDPKKRLNCEQILNHPWLEDSHSHKINLFSKAEKNLLRQTYIDYRKIKMDELIENFTMSNLFGEQKNSNEKYNCETKSSLLAPFNSINFEYFNISEINKKKCKDNNEFEDFCNKKLIIENDLFVFSNKAKEYNYQYELDNNKEVDNGVLINTKSINESNSSSFSNANSKRNFINDKSLNLNFEDNELTNNTNFKREKILCQIESLGYDREYVIRSLKNNFLNHATTIYFLLMNYEKI